MFSYLDCQGYFETHVVFFQTALHTEQFATVDVAFSDAYDFLVTITYSSGKKIRDHLKMFYFFLMFIFTDMCLSENKHLSIVL